MIEEPIDNDSKIIVGMRRYTCGCEQEIYGDYTLGDWKKLCGKHEGGEQYNLIPLIECWICQDGVPARYVRDLEDHEEVLCERCVIDTGILYENGILNEKEAEELCFRRISKKELDSGEINWGLFWKQKNRFKNLKLKMVAIPTCLAGNSLQQKLSQKEWRIIRNNILEKYGNECAICGSTENLVCHEVWEHDDENLIQKLKECIAICRRCHITTHPTMASFEAKKGNIDIEKVKEHFMKINECDENLYYSYKDYMLGLEISRTIADGNWKVDFGEYSNLIQNKNINQRRYIMEKKMERKKYSKNQFWISTEADQHPILCYLCGKDIGIIDDETAGNFGYRPVRKEELETGIALCMGGCGNYKERLKCFGVPCIDSIIE